MPSQVDKSVSQPADMGQAPLLGAIASHGGPDGEIDDGGIDEAW